MKLVAIDCMFLNSIPDLLFILVSIGPTVATRILIRKLRFLSKLLFGTKIQSAAEFSSHLQWEMSLRHLLSNTQNVGSTPGYLSPLYECTQYVRVTVSTLISRSYYVQPRIFATI